MATRTDTDRLNWLIENGYVPALRRCEGDVWLFEWDEWDGAESWAQSKSERGAIDLAMSAHEEEDAR